LVFVFESIENFTLKLKNLNTHKKDPILWVLSLQGPFTFVRSLKFEKFFSSSWILGHSLSALALGWTFESGMGLKVVPYPI
jgi:hypothetical protein